MSGNKPYKNILGVETLYYPGVFLGLLFFGYFITGFVYQRNLIEATIAFFCLSIFVLFLWSNKKINAPEIILWTVIVFGYFMDLVFRFAAYYLYIVFTWGVAREILLVFVYLLMFFIGGRSIKFGLLKNGLMYATLLWSFYIFVQLFNPNQTQFIPWFYACRPYFYPLFSIPLVFILVNQRHHFEFLLKLFLLFGLIAGIYGMIQWYMWYYMGGMNPLDAWYVDYKNMEETHLFWGILLRTFGLYSDAAVMGSVQAFTAIIAGILFLHSDESYKTRAYYLLVFLICMIGFAISGTRGALIVFIPMVIYVLLCRKLLLQVSLTIMGVTIIYVLVFTYLFQNVYTINRLRTAFNPEDASMRIRIETRNENEKYINTHLMGWGLGTTGYLGKRFYGLKNVIEDPDGSFLVYHAELGILGFIFYWLFNIFVFGRTFWLLYKVKVPDKLYFQILGVSCALLGLTFQGYTGQGMSTYVTNFAGPMLMGYMWLSKHWFKGEELPEFKSNII